MIHDQNELDFFLKRFDINNLRIQIKFSQFNYRLLQRIDFRKVSIYIEDIIDEVYISFSLKNPMFQNSGEIMFFLREDNTKIYLYKKKIKLENDYHSFLKSIDYMEKILKGKYTKTPVHKKNGEFLKYDISLSINSENNGECLII